jgi:DNA-binding NtrC family response regulator
MPDKNTEKEQKTLLIVDDNYEILNYLSNTLSNHGYKIIEAENAKEGLALAKKFNPVVAFLDIKLPDFNGIELSKRISSILPQIIIILMTGYPNIRDALKNLEDRVFDYLIKPFKIQQLLMSMKRAKKYSELVEENNQYQKEIQSLEQKNDELRAEIRQLLGTLNRDSRKALGKTKPKNKYLDSYKKQQEYSD